MIHNPLYVIDSNALTSDTLRAYLSDSTRNYAVLTDHLAIEAYQDQNIDSLYRYMEILAQFPTQVMVLKSTQNICALQGQRAGLEAQLIDMEQTQGFPTFCRVLVAAKNGNQRASLDLLEKGAAACAELDALMPGANNVKSEVANFAKNYNEDELRIIRNKGQFTGQMIKKLIRSILEVTDFLFSDHPMQPRRPSKSELPFTYIFRFSLCACVRAIMWISVGGAHAKPERIRNDLTDMSFAAYGTLFDGLITSDQKLYECYAMSMQLLNRILEPHEA